MNTDQLLSTHRGYVTEVALKYRRFGVPLDDLINEGAIGLLEAAQRFDASRGTKFLTYASYWIHKQILGALEYQSRVVRVPDYRLKRIRKRLKLENNLLQELGRPPTREEIRARLHLSGEPWTGALPQATVEVSIDDEADSVRSAIQALVDQSTAGPEDSLLHDETTILVRNALEILAPRERQVLVARYGLEGRPRRTLREVAAVLDISREGVRKIEMSARQKIARFLTTRHTGTIGSRIVTARAKRPVEA